MSSRSHCQAGRCCPCQSGWTVHMGSGMSTAVARGTRALSWERAVLRSMIGLPLLGLLVFFVFPLITVAWNSLHLRDGSFGFSNYATIWQSPGLIQAIIHSFVLGISVTVVCVVLGFVIAYAIERSALRGKNVIRGALTLPLLAPSLVQAIGLLFLLGHSGLVSRWTGWEFNIYGFWGLLIADVF